MGQTLTNYIIGPGGVDLDWTIRGNKNFNCFSTTVLVCTKLQSMHGICLEGKKGVNENLFSKVNCIQIAINKTNMCMDQTWGSQTLCKRSTHSVYIPITDLEDVGEISQVENIVEFNSCGEKVLNHDLVKPYCCLYQSRAMF